LLPADIDQALQQATQLPAAVQRYLQQLIAKLDETPWYSNGQQLTNQRLFTPLRVLVTKPRRQEEGSRRPSEREGAEAQKEKPGDAYAELQAPLYELTREYAQKEEIRWGSLYGVCNTRSAPRSSARPAAAKPSAHATSC
jgi:hypothetical protein